MWLQDKKTRKKHRKKRRKAMFVFFYSLFTRLGFGNDLKFMNHGYAPLGKQPDFLALKEDDESFRYALQLYHILASEADWESKYGVEVSSGNGGGSDYIYTTFKPRKLVGIDLAGECVKKANAEYAREGLSFMLGNAQDLPLDSDRVDILINVESSLNYPEPDKFIKEVYRVLKPGGIFLYADYFRPARLSRVEASIENCDFKREKKADLTRNVLRSMELSEPGKQDFLKKRIPFFLRRLFSQFIFSGAYYEKEKARFETGDKTYFFFILKKQSL